MDAVLQAMADEAIGPGDRSRQFLQQFKEFSGLDGAALALRSAETALRFVFACIAGERGTAGVQGTKIAISALSPLWYANVAFEKNIELDICDIDPTTGLLSLEAARNSVSMGANAILVHDPNGNFPIGQSYAGIGVPVIEDITESLGGRYGDDFPARDADFVVCSFEEQSIVSTGGGAIVLCKDKKFQPILDSMADALKPHVQLPDLNAALGCIQITQAGRNIERRRAIFRRYQLALMHTRHTMFGIPDIDFEINGQGFAVFLDSRPEDVIKFGLRYETAVIRTFERTLANLMKDRFDRLPHALPAALRCVSFPLYPFLLQHQVEQIEKVLSHLP